MTGPHRSLTPTEPEEALDLFLRERSTDSADSTVQAYQYRLNHFVRWCNEGGEFDNLNDLSGRDLHEYKLWRKEDGDLNETSLKGQMDTLRVFIRFCESIDAVESDLHSKVISPSLSDGIGQRDVKLDSGEAEELLNYLRRFEYASFSHLLLLLLWQTGMRMGSIRALDLSDYHPEEEYIAVRHRPDSETPLKNKENGERLVALDPTTCAVVTDWIEHQRPNVTDKYGRKPLISTENGRASKNTVRTTVYRWTRPCQYAGECPHGRDPDEGEAMEERWTASKCPSSVSPPRCTPWIYHLPSNRGCTGKSR